MIENNIIEILPIYNETLYVESHSKPNFEAKFDTEKPEILVLVSSEDLNDETNILLEKMLAACKFSPKDYQILSVSQSSVLDAINHHQPSFVLLFGFTLSSSSFDVRKEKYTPFRLGGKKMLLCDSLVKISANPTLKSVLWTNGLKVLFNIKP